MQGYYDWRNWAIALALCRMGDTIVEVGANIGTETVGFADIVGPEGRVVAFEPLPENLETLRSNKSEHGWSNVEVIAAAVTDRSGRAYFAPPTEPEMSGVGHLARGDAPERIEVDCVPLDALLERFEALSAIFCDIEGGEPLMLDGAKETIRRFQPALVLEASQKLLQRAGSSLEQLHGSLLELDYVIFEIRRFGVQRIASSPTRGSNWLALPHAKHTSAKACSRMILRCGMMPFVLGLNPLTSPRRPRSKR